MKKLIKKLSFITLVLAICLLMFYKCPLKTVIGLSCPGCGMTRALLALLHFDFKLAFYYHPLFIVGIILFIFFILSEFNLFIINKKAKNISLYFLCSLLIICYFIRLFSGSDIVCFDFKSSLIYMIFS